MKQFKKISGVMLLLIMIFIIAPTSHANAKKVKINKTHATMKVGKTLQLKIKGTTEKTTWKSSKPNVATVSKNGKVKAKKAGKTTITAKVSGTSYKCRITVKKKKSSKKSNSDDEEDSIQYIGDRSVEYYSSEALHRVFFSLKLSDQETRVSSSGNATIKIVNTANEEVYNKTIAFTEKNFSKWTNPTDGTRYLCSIEIPDSELTAGTASKGTLSLYVKLVNGTYFNETSYSITDLKTIDYTQQCSLAFAKEKSVTYRDSNNVVQFNNITYKFTPNRSDASKVDLTVTYIGTKTKKSYDYFFYDYKLRRTDTKEVAASGMNSLSDLSVGENKQETLTFSNLTPGPYRLILGDETIMDKDISGDTALASSRTAAENFEALKQYIQSNGDTNSSGNKFIKDTYTMSSDECTSAIVYDQTEKSYHFIFSTESKLSSGITVSASLELIVQESDLGKSSLTYLILYSSGISAICKAETNTANLNSSAELNWTVEKVSLSSDETWKENANTYYTLSHISWDIFLLEKLNMTLSNLGFAQ